MTVEEKYKTFSELDKVVKETKEPEYNKDELASYLNEPREKDPERASIEKLNKGIRDNVAAKLDKSLDGELPTVEAAAPMDLSAASANASAIQSVAAAKTNYDFQMAKELTKELTNQKQKTEPVKEAPVKETPTTMGPGM